MRPAVQTLQRPPSRAPETGEILAQICVVGGWPAGANPKGRPGRTDRTEGEVHGDGVDARLAAQLRTGVAARSP